MLTSEAQLLLHSLPLTFHLRGTQWLLPLHASVSSPVKQGDCYCFMRLGFVISIECVNTCQLLGEVPGVRLALRKY